MSRLRIAYSVIPNYLSDEYTYDQILSYAFTGFPELTKLKEWLEIQSEENTEEYRACSMILAYRNLAFRFGATSEEEFEIGLGKAMKKVLLMDKMTLEEITKELGKEFLARDN